jgi:hypothetical protein
MRLPLNFIVAFGSLLAVVSPAEAQETTITVGTAGNITSTNSFSGQVVGETLSTVQVDGVLQRVAPGTFGNNFTRDRANKLFSDFTNLRVNLAPSLAQTLPTVNSKILRVNSIVINTTNLNLRLSQKNNSVFCQLGTVMASTSIKYDSNIPIVCPSATIRFDINNIKVSGDYNFISGDISNASASYTVDNISTSCGGILGFIGDAFNSAFLGGSESRVRNAVEGAFNSQLAFINMKSLFSLADFANGLHYYGNETIISQFANRAVNILKELVNDASINTPRIFLDVKIALANGVSSQNTIEILASHAPVDITSLTKSGSATFSVPPNTQQTDIYYKRGSGNWIYFTSTTGNSVSGIPVPLIPSLGQTFVIGIGRNSLISGLESFLGVSLGVVNQVCPGGGISC